ncbi:MAG: hypothetical protein IJI84_02345 [Clostridia bacterium]|nr:hypothetical protein [Clostridia bacterium]
MSLFSSIKEKIPEKIKKDPIWKTSSQITSTLNEFSTVEKAMLAFQYCDKNPIKVQINPNDLEYEYQSQQDPTILLTSSLDGKPREAVETTDPRIKGTLTFTLNYDFYDEYYARSANGSGFSLNSLTSNSFHLKNEKFSSLETIMQQSKLHAAVLFKWGEIEEFGYIHTARPRYTAFSPWGEPLKAQVTITITILNYNGENGINLSGTIKDIYEDLSKKISEGTSAIGGTIKKLGSTIKALR